MPSCTAGQHMSDRSKAAMGRAAKRNEVKVEKPATDVSESQEEKTASVDGVDVEVSTTPTVFYHSFALVLVLIFEYRQWRANVFVPSHYWALQNCHGLYHLAVSKGTVQMPTYLTSKHAGLSLMDDMSRMCCAGARSMRTLSARKRARGRRKTSAATRATEQGCSQGVHLSMCM
jgi:hypothetical protein